MDYEMILEFLTTTVLPIATYVFGIGYTIVTFVKRMGDMKKDTEASMDKIRKETSDLVEQTSKCRLEYEQLVKDLTYEVEELIEQNELLTDQLAQKIGYSKERKG